MNNNLKAALYTSLVILPLLCMGIICVIWPFLAKFIPGILGVVLVTMCTWLNIRNSLNDKDSL